MTINYPYLSVVNSIDLCIYYDGVILNGGAYSYTGTVPDNTEAEYDALVWTDARPKPDWSFIHDVLYTNNIAYSLYSQPQPSDFLYGDGALDTRLTTAESEISTITTTLSGISEPDISGLVTKITTVNGHALSSNVTVTSSDVGLGSVNNTSDSAKPLSSAAVTALAGKVDNTITVNGHVLTSNVTVSQSDVGLGNVNNTSDLNKPISTATQTALNAKPDVWFGNTKQTNPKFFTGSATVTSGTAVYYLTADGTSTGTAIMTTPNMDSLNYYVNDATASYQVSGALSNSNKTLTLTVNKLTTANLLSGVLGQAAANAAVVKVSLWGA